MSQALKRYCSELSQSVSLLNWGLFLASAVLAFWAARMGYRYADGPQVYPDFIVGGNTWLALSKQQDYLLLFTFVFGFLASFLLLGTCQLFARRIVGEGAFGEFHDVVVYACVPALMWLPGIIITDRTNTDLLLCSALLIFLVLALLTVLLPLPREYWDNERRLLPALGGGTVYLALATLAGSVLAFVLSRAGLWFDSAAVFSTREFAVTVPGVFLCAGLPVFILQARASGTSQAFRPRLARLIGFSQLFFPLGFLVILPNIWDLDGVVEYAYPATFYAYLIPCFLIMLAYFDLYRCNRYRTAEHSVFRGISPLCMVGLLLFLKQGMVGAPSVPLDSYHFGEFFTAWWSWQQFDLLPFQDYVPARGMLNYLPGALNQLFFDGTATSFSAVSPYLAALVLAFCFPVVALSVGTGPAFIGFLLMPLPDGVFSVHFVLAASLCFCCRGVFLYRPVTWLLTWLVTGVFLVLFATGPGGLWVLATLPIGVWMFWQAFHQQRPLLLKACGFSLLAVVALAVLTPLAAMVWGAIRYGIEQSSVNSVAHGLEWANNLGKTRFNFFLFEAVRSSWIIVALVAGCLILSAPKLSIREDRRRLLVYAVPVFIICVLFVMRAAGRIDADGPSRLGQASIWALSLLLPMLLFAARKHAGGRKAGSAVFFVLLASLIANLYGTIPGNTIFFKSTMRTAAPNPAETKLVRFVGAELGMPRLGNGMINNQHKYLLLGINQFLQKTLNEDETYLDISGHSANYFYMDRRPPIESVAPYNLAHANQQLRAIEALQDDLPPLVLAYAFNDNHDGGTLGLRSPLLYRFLVPRYIPVMDGVFVWLVRPDRLSRVGDGRDRKPEQGIMALRKAFGEENLWQIPLAWGRSYASLQDKMQEIAILRPGGGQAVDLRNGQFLTLDLTQHKLAGMDAGLIVFELETDSRTPVDFTVSWTAKGQPFFNELRGVRFKAGNGLNVLPMDAQPHWLLAERLEYVRIAPVRSVNSGKIQIRQVKLAQRKDAGLLPGARID